MNKLCMALAGTLLVKSRPADPVGKALHHQRAIGHHREKPVGHSGVVAEQITLRQPGSRPVDLGQVGDAELAAVWQLDRAVAPGVLERAQLIDDPAVSASRFARAPARR